MDKNFIGIDIDDQILRIAVFARKKGDTALVRLEEHPFENQEDMLKALPDLVGNSRFGDRIAAAIPALESFVRPLKFPFADIKKIESALSFGLAGQLPVDMDDYVADFQKPAPAPEGEGYRITAAAVRSGYLEDLVGAFDSAGVSLNILDLAPFPYAFGLRDRITRGILVCINLQEITISHIEDGSVCSFRLLPTIPGQTSGDLGRLIRQESMALQHEAAGEDLPLVLIGSGCTPELLEELKKQGIPAAVPEYELNGKLIPPAFLPAIALARRAAAPDREGELNFRRGRFALKSEWAALKKDLIAAGLILLLSISVLAGSAWFGYAEKVARAEALEQQMARVYRQTFPDARAVVDVPMQMESKIKELQERGRAFAAGMQESPLSVLREISSRIPEGLTVDIRDLNYSPDSVRLQGETTSFDAVNQLAKSLEGSSLFREAQIADAKVSVEGSQVDFRLNLTLPGQGVKK